ncbi:ras association domain-containing protein 10 [Carlito syrichta]|uniref:Ras association domain-containing protein 10 n=1 Tax=Carlito syrichta TaxID=1868482 RepID=A0A3Q0E0C2_CARSF|nr:ras association domain-containing protein 10 [Carlito syrichta]
MHPASCRHKEVSQRAAGDAEPIPAEARAPGPAAEGSPRLPWSRRATGQPAGGRGRDSGCRRRERGADGAPGARRGCERRAWALRLPRSQPQLWALGAEGGGATWGGAKPGGPGHLGQSQSGGSPIPGALPRERPSSGPSAAAASAAAALQPAPAPALGAQPGRRAGAAAGGVTGSPPVPELLGSPRRPAAPAGPGRTPPAPGLRHGSLGEEDIVDREIDRYEAKVHLDRMRRHGVNYVQDTYLVGADLEPDKPSPGEEPEAAAAAAAAAAPPLDDEVQAAAMAELARRCEDLLRLQEQRVQQEELLERLSAEIQEELNQRWMQRRQEELAAREEAPEPDGSPDGELLLEQERVRTQLSTSLYIGLRLNTDLEAVKSDLDYSQQQRDSKERELQGLLQTLHTLELTGAPDGAPGPGGPSREPGPQACAEVWVDQARGLAKSCPGNDEDSDTGLSSMHSQDSDSVPVCESLV